jgi:hypothetical protein
MTYTMTIRDNIINLDTTAGTITGETYKAKEAIKEEFPGIKWDGRRKAWTMDGAAMEARINEYNDYFRRVYNLSAATETATATTKTTKARNGRCPICGGYCYGDCRA